MSAFLRIEHIDKAYPGVKALKDVSFEVQGGSLHALVGENGAGKSTLIKILAGAELPDSGRIWLDGKSYAPRGPRDALAASIATIYQAFNLLPDRTIMHNLLLGKEPAGRAGILDMKAMHEQATAILAVLNAGHLSPDLPVRELKVGEQQIIEIAKALLNRSRLLIMDEPTAALNQNEVSALFQNIALLKQQGVTVLYVSHRLDEIFQLADRVTVLRDGAHISTRPIAEITRDSLIEDMIGRKLTSVFPPRAEPAAGGESEVILRVEGLTVGKLLDDITFNLHRGEVLAIAGLSGSGKTELGKALFGDLPTDAGHIVLKGRSLKMTPRQAIRSRLIYLPEDRKVDGVFQLLNIKRNISVPVLERIARWLGILDLKCENRIAQAQVDALEIKTPSLSQQITDLSGGNQQKVVLARCLAVGPDIFILMEPTQGIDVGVKFEIYQFIAGQAASGKAVVLISSELTEILGLAHRILVMHDGRIVAELDARLTTQEEILRCALGERAEQPVEMSIE